MKKLILIMALAGTLAACEPTPINTEAKDAYALVNSFVYVKATNGLCFGVSTISRVSSGGEYSLASPIVNVPCNAVEIQK